MTQVDLNAWIGRTISIEDAMDVGHAARIAATLGGPAPDRGQPLSPLWHWCYFLEGAAMGELGTDGHPARGGFLPPADNRNRMWAGSRVTFEGDLLVGVPAQKTSSVKDIVEKTGKTGSLLFVTVTHQVMQDGRRVIHEEQDIVYRAPSPPKLQGTDPAPHAQWRMTVEPSSVWLFRYSALTFNGHRIHYDFPYVTEQEGYPGLVVHGPLIATSMVNSFCKAHPGSRVKHLAYRGLRPLICPTPFVAAGAMVEDGLARVWAEQDGTLAHQGEIRFE
jgi:itaconyl-CoA hydratase / mesaconyl-C4 CoA hydratase